eukprot:gene10339-biopygen12307
MGGSVVRAPGPLSGAHPSGGGSRVIALLTFLGVLPRGLLRPKYPVYRVGRVRGASAAVSPWYPRFGRQLAARKQSSPFWLPPALAGWVGSVFAFDQLSGTSPWGGGRTAGDAVGLLAKCTAAWRLLPRFAEISALRGACDFGSTWKIGRSGT